MDSNKTVSASFSSKLLATINPEMPVWDSVVLNRLGIKAPKSNVKNKMKQINEAIDVYDTIVHIYKSATGSTKAKEIIAVVDELFPGNNFTSIKKIDLALWSMGVNK